ncbi:hypothetical protein D3C77_346250 [compost metagenome]
MACQLRLQALAHVPAFAHCIEITLITAARFDALQGIEHLIDLGQLRHGGVGACQLLPQIMHATGCAAVPGCRLQTPGEDLRQHCLAHAIASDQAGAALVEAFVEIGKQLPAIRQGKGDAIERQDRDRGHMTLQKMPATSPIKGDEDGPSNRRRH